MPALTTIPGPGNIAQMGEILAALQRRTNTLPVTTYSTNPGHYAIYGYTADHGTALLTTEHDEYVVAFAPVPGLDKAIEWLGTRSDAEAGTTFYPTAGEAVDALLDTLARHELVTA